MASFEELKALVDAGDWKRLVELGMPRTLIGREKIWLYGYNPETGNAFTPEEQQSFGEQNNAGYKKVGEKTYGPGDVIPGESLQDYAARFAEMGGGQFGYKGKSYLMNRRGQFYEIGTPEPAGFLDTEENLGNLYYGSVKQIKGAGPAKIIDPTKGRVTGYDSSGNLVYAKSATQDGPIEGKVVVRTTQNVDGSTTYFYSDNTSSTSTDFGGSSEGATAFDVFKNTLSLFFGAPEMNKPWVSQIYKSVSGYTKSGSTPEEAFNMAVLEARNDPALADFTKRFKGIYALQKMKQEGKAVTVPTVAEYFATESKMGDILKASNLGDLANEDFLGDVLSKGVSATEFANRITNIFDRIDIAPDVTKKTIARYFPTLDGTQLARALALGERGAKQLEQDLAGYEVLSAAESQGLGVSSTLPGGVTNEQAQQIAKAGGTFASTLGQFGQIAQARETEQKLAEISGMKSLGVTGLTSAVISKSAKELKALEDLTRQEEARFSGKAGNIGSKSFASQARANRVI